MKKLLLTAVLFGVCTFPAQAWYRPCYYRPYRYYAPRFAYSCVPVVYPAYPAYPAYYPVVYPAPYYPAPYYPVPAYYY